MTASETDKMYRSMIDHVREAVFVLDASRLILFANRAALRQFGEGLEGKSFVRFIRNPACLEAIDEVRAGAKHRQLQFHYDGPYRIIFEATVAALDGKVGRSSPIMVSLADISHIHEAEQMRSDFVANVSHELRSPLTTLTGFIETLKGPARGDLEAADRFLDLMETEAGRMVRLIHDLLSLSKVEASQRIRPEGVVDVRSVIQRLTKTLSVLAEREQKSVVLEDDGQQDPTLVTGNDDELIQVFQNLIENAIKYGRQGTDVRIAIQPVKDAVGIRGPGVSVSVIDEGEGIPREHIPRLTERFYRVDTHRSRDKGGTGLGLAIVKHIVTRHRGRLLIESDLGKGSTFRVILPAPQTVELDEETASQ